MDIKDLDTIMASNERDMTVEDVSAILEELLQKAEEEISSHLIAVDRDYFKFLLGSSESLKIALHLVKSRLKVVTYEVC